jgi:hypothetical protein
MITCERDPKASGSRRELLLGSGFVGHYARSTSTRRRLGFNELSNETWSFELIRDAEHVEDIDVAIYIYFDFVRDPPLP